MKMRNVAKILIILVLLSSNSFAKKSDKKVHCSCSCSRVASSNIKPNNKNTKTPQKKTTEVFTMPSGNEPSFEPVK